MHSKALVLFSGGQDSTTCLAWALENYEYVETIGFDYGQRHNIELKCRLDILNKIRTDFPIWSKKLGEDHILDLKLLGQISETAMTSEKAIEFQENGLPNTFVPGRNLIFLTFAATIAYRRSLTVLVCGVSETDFSGYPDCRDNTLKATQIALSLGLDFPLLIETPLMWRDKSQVWSLSESLGGKEFVELIRDETHTCYLGTRDEKHDWGYGCASCPACDLRKAGYIQYSKNNK